ncbi:phenylalanyl-tRNA synthetase beta subunit [Arboricoccus pini]|uniref:Phenylalanine--tRNA ligase beta subunit n=1 Tax=Arboricoccus pini TaxID=1963835 RepID=A0A212RCW1_9PROT|nr:phenylalanine--tRNA ligase subunit beta [Arboricoccus pini]SNB70086.1 phenylalanyl-tRNA synthetase beta subunit [Arboricoccus pini]
MKLTLPWLTEHLDTDKSLAELADKMTALGLEVEEIVDPGAPLEGFTVAHVLSTRPHPDAERLKICTVDTKDGLKEIVCGAPNARGDIWGILAVEGLRIPASGEVLKKARIRGVESQGMLCSARELGLGQDHDGIIELSAEGLEVGMPAACALGLEGPVIEVKLTPDRADCFGIAGIARDLAAAGMGRLRPRSFDPIPVEGPSGPGIRLDFMPEQRQACPLFVGRRISGVRNGASPRWLQERLRAVGLRPISALVDITNFVMLDINRPLHVFDLGKLEGDLTVRMARPGEKLAALDQRTYELDAQTVVVADDKGPQALGGIMGGEASGVTEATTDILLEIALFDPMVTARTGRRLGIESDARVRFERGLDPELVMPATEYATRLILEICGGKAGPSSVAGEMPAWRRPMSYRPAALQRLTGIELESGRAREMLLALGFEVEASAQGGQPHLDVVPPSWRGDITTEACIVEELARLVGYEHIPETSVHRETSVGRPVLTVEQRRRSLVRRVMAESGLFEAVTWSFIPPAQAVLFGAASPILKQNPLNAELSAMRPSLLPNLLSAAARNYARSIPQGGLFELGPRFKGAQPGEQVWGLAGLRFGAAGPRTWSQAPRLVDALDAKADALAAIEAAGIRADAVQVSAEAPVWYHPGRSGALKQGPNVLAYFGQIHPRVQQAFDLDAQTVAFELDLDALPHPKARGKNRAALETMPYPPVDRDFAFIVDGDREAESLLKSVRLVDRKLVREVRLFDVYQGKGLPEGKKSFGVAVRLQAADRTLAEAEIDAIARRIVEAAAKHGASLRQ